VIDFRQRRLWRIRFWVGGAFCKIQTIIAGAMMLKPTSEERIALAD
jgi:hypothetical protein